MSMPRLWEIMGLMDRRDRFLMTLPLLAGRRAARGIEG
jgi:hypothetical protein